MLSYGLRLNVLIAPFLVPVLVLAAIISFVTGHASQGLLLAGLALWSVVFVSICKFWLRAKDEDEAREWQRRNRENDITD